MAGRVKREAAVFAVALTVRTGAMREGFVKGVRNVLVLVMALVLPRQAQSFIGRGSNGKRVDCERELGS